jgi:hypothetical protein
VGQVGKLEMVAGVIGGSVRSAALVSSIAAGDCPSSGHYPNIYSNGGTKVQSSGSFAADVDTAKILPRTILRLPHRARPGRHSANFNRAVLTARSCCSIHPIEESHKGRSVEAGPDRCADE